MRGAIKAISLPPAAHAKIVTALRAARRGRLGGCAHLTDVPVACWCFQHPGRLWCPDCFERHIELHTEYEEFSCDVCGRDLRSVDDLMAAMAHRFDLDELVPVGRGRYAAVGPVVLGGWARCAECDQEAER